MSPTLSAYFLSGDAIRALWTDETGATRTSVYELIERGEVVDVLCVTIDKLPYPLLSEVCALLRAHDVTGRGYSGAADVSIPCPCCRTTLDVIPAAGGILINCDECGAELVTRVSIGGEVELSIVEAGTSPDAVATIPVPYRSLAQVTDEWRAEMASKAVYP